MRKQLEKELNWEVKGFRPKNKSTQLKSRADYILNEIITINGQVTLKNKDLTVLDFYKNHLENETI
ncbi:hypothetical protein V2647_03760 [Tenacibaculum maritimum]|uniref:hypothetical protein n=1 Tax=Tenacibaculum maritimum TaxID=107401 RepID=UPI003876DFA3